MDLKAHQLEAHPIGLSKDARRDARLVDMSSFDYRTPYQESRGRRDGRGRGRGRDPNTEALPQSPAQPMRRDEIMSHRLREIQSAQSLTPRSFGGQLTRNDVRQGETQGPSTVTARRGNQNSLPAVDNLNLEPNPQSAPASPRPNHATTPQEQARQIQHTAVVDRASQLLRNDPVKISEFRRCVSAYRSSSMSATQLIDTFFSLFDSSSADLGKLIKELADIYEIGSKRNDLLKAWNDWRAINEDYPSLPGPSGTLPGSTTDGTGSGGTRILRLKNSTAQSSRSAVSRHGSWNQEAGREPFPPMPVASNKTAAQSGNVPWASASSAAPSTAPAKPIPKPNSKLTNQDAFPALPAAARPNTLMAGLVRGTVRWDDRSNPNPNAGAWGSGAAANGNQAKASTSEPETEGETSQAGKKKGNKNKKQTLYKFG